MDELQGVHIADHFHYGTGSQMFAILVPIILKSIWHGFEDNILDFGVSYFFSIVRHFAVVLDHYLYSLVELFFCGREFSCILVVNLGLQKLWIF